MSRHQTLLVLLIISVSFISPVYSHLLVTRQKLEAIRKQQDICFGTVIDAGSSSTRLSVYSWVCNDIGDLKKLNPISKLYVTNNPGLSAFNKNITGISGYLQPMIDKAKETIPAELHSVSPIMLGATAGVRLLVQEDQDKVISEARSILSKSGFKFVGKHWNRVISGKEEGLYLWIAANFLSNAISDDNQDQTQEPARITTIDLGGASVQIAFKLSKPDIKKYNLGLSTDNSYGVFSASYLGYGNDRARVSMLELEKEASQTKDISSGCFNKGYNFTDPNSQQLVTGTSEPERCLEQIRKVFKKDTCKDKDQSNFCSITSNFDQLIPTQNPVLAVSSLANVVKDLKMPIPFSPDQLLQAATDFCNRPYSEVQQNDPKNKYLATQCFLGLYSASLLTDAFHLDKYQIYITGEQKNEPAWALGYLFDNVSKLRCHKDKNAACKMQEFIQHHFDITLSVSNE